MKTLSDVAADYDNEATANEAIAEEILACLDSLPGEIQEQQRQRASQLVADAAALKIQAKELRDLDGRLVEIMQGGHNVPQDRNPGRNRPQTIWRYNRFR